jgi:hypothetical protein
VNYRGPRLGVRLISGPNRRAVATYEELEDRGELQRPGEFGRGPVQSRPRGSGIRGVGLRTDAPSLCWA